MKKYIILIILHFPISAYCQDLIGITALNLVFALTRHKEIPLEDVMSTSYTRDEKKLKFKEIQKLNIAIHEHPDSAVFYMHRGTILKDLGVNRDAQLNFEKALKKGSIDSSLYLYLGQCSFLNGYRRLALEYLDTQIEKFPKDARPHLYKGIVEMYHQKSKFHSFKARCEASIPRFTQALTVNPKLKEALLLRGYAYQHLKNYEAAIQDYKKILSIYPDDASVEILLGKAYLDSGNKSTACEHFNKAKSYNAKVSKKLIKRSCEN